MGFCLTQTPEMGEYGGEVRSESFYLSGEYNYKRIGDALCPSGCTVDGEHTHGEWDHVENRHGITVYPVSDKVNQGTVEILIEDIPKIRAVLDAVESHVEENR